MDTKVEIKAGDCVMYRFLGKISIDFIVNVDSDGVVTYRQLNEKAVNTGRLSSISYYQDRYIGKVHPILVKLYGWDKEI